jgi:glycosyltransferase involved in cell wall biosynthesis
MLSELFYPHGSGGELATYLYAELLRKAGINVVVVTNRFSGEPEVSRSENLIVYRLPLFNETKGVKYSILRRFDILVSGFMRKLMKWADIVYIPKFWFSAIPFAKAYGKPVIVHLHGYHPVCPLSVLYDFSKNRMCQHHHGLFCSLKCITTDARKKTPIPQEVLESVALNSIIGHYMDWFVRLSNSIVCVSKAQEKLIMEHMPSVAKKLHVIYNPLPQVVDFNRKVGDFGYFGGSSLLKGFSVLCQALRKVNPKINIHLTKMPKVSVDLLDELRQLGGIAHEILPRDLYRKLYKKIQVVVVPSVWPEPWGYIVSEALLSKRLVIASRVGGIPEQTEGLEGAFSFQPGSSEQLADQIEYVRDLSEEVRTELGFKNKEKFLARFDNKKTLGEFINVLNKVSK